MRRITLLSVALAGVMVSSAAAGCSRGQDPPDPGRTRIPDTTASPTPGGAGPAGQPPEGDDGTAAGWPTVFNSWTGGGELPTDCATLWEVADPPVPYIGDGTAAPVTIHIGDSRQICLTGFDAASPIELTVERPDGRTRTTTVRGGGEATVDPAALLGPELPAAIRLADLGTHLATAYAEVPPTSLAGWYAIVAEQGEVRAETRLRLRRGPLGDRDTARVMPQSDYADAYEIGVGDELDILLLDFAPNARVPLALYRNTGVAPEGREGNYDFRLVRPLPAVEVNGQGWAYHRIVVPDGLPDPENEHHPDFCVVAVPELTTPHCQPGFAATFSLRD
jgi:hypothetical protein